MTRTLVFVGCGSSKRDERCEAGDMYTSGYYNLKQKWAEQHGDEWRVVSAKHGILHPSEEIDPYDITPGGESWDSRMTEHWRSDVAAQMEVLEWDRIEEVVVLAGWGKYVSKLKPVFDSYTDRAEFRYPLKGMRLFEQQSWLSENTE